MEYEYDIYICLIVPKHDGDEATTKDDDDDNDITVYSQFEMMTI